MSGFNFNCANSYRSGGVTCTHGAVVVHPTTYDGCLELGAMQLGYGALGSNMAEQNYRCSKEVVKTHLLQDYVCEFLCSFDVHT